METILKFTRGATFRQDIQWNDKNGISLFSGADLVSLIYTQSLDKKTRIINLDKSSNKVTIEFTDEETSVMQNSYFWIYAEMNTGDRVKIVSGRLISNE